MRNKPCARKSAGPGVSAELKGLLAEHEKMRKAELSDFDALLAALGDRDRANISRHLAACEGEDAEAHAKLWKRLSGSLAALAPQGIRTTGQRAVQFFVPDGKYRKQVFALEDPGEGNLHLYTSDVIGKAVKAGIFGASEGAAASGDDDDDQDGPVAYGICGEAEETLTIEALTAANTTAAPEFYRHMLGWNRKALRITLPTTATPPQIRAAELLCVLAVQGAAS